MAQLLVRDISDELVRALKQRAAANGRSAEAEHRALLSEALTPPRDLDTLREAMRRAREETRGVVHTPSEVLLREEREERDRRWD
jgi:plasmid stability protein